MRLLELPMPDLDPSGWTVAVEDLGIRTPGYTGTVTRVDPRVGAGLRASGNTSEAFADALDRAEMTTEHVLELEATEQPGTPAADGTRAPGDPFGGIQLDVPDVAEG